jgi:hypothetical protein
MENVISIQDAYIASLIKKNESDRNVEVISSKNWKKAMTALRALGIEGTPAEKIMMDANDIVQLTWRSRR